MLTVLRPAVARLALAGASLAILMTACAVPGTSGGGGARNGSVPAAAQVGAPKISISVPDGSQGIALDAPVTVSTDSGRLEKVSISEAGSSAAPAGAISQDGRTWTLAGGMDPDAHYVIEASASNGSGGASSAQASFSTLTAQNRLLTTVSPDDGATVGVGEPLVLKFSWNIPDASKAKLLQRIQISSNPGVVGAWHWFSDATVHFRTRDYWPAGTHVTVTANLKGFDAGEGAWGLDNWSSSFVVGDKHLSVLDNSTDQMQVYQNDQLINTWPISMGKSGFETIQGTLIVLYKQYDVKMKSCSTFGGAACIPGSTNYYSDDVYWDTAISTTGFFIHAAPWSVGDQGYRNVSHGCVNLSIARATTFFNWSQPGDVVVVKNTGNNDAPAAGEPDWQIDFSQWSNTNGFGNVWTGSPAAASQGGRLF